MSTLELVGFDREYPNSETRDRRYIEAYLFALEAFTRDTPHAEEAYGAIVCLSEILVRRGLLPAAYDRAHTIRLSEPMTEVELIELLENVSITGEVMWSTNSMTAKQEEGSTGIYSGIVPEHLLIENEEPDIRVD